MGTDYGTATLSETETEYGRTDGHLHHTDGRGGERIEADRFSQFLPRRVDGCGWVANMGCCTQNMPAGQLPSSEQQALTE